MAYTPYYDKDGKEYKVQSRGYKNLKQHRVIDIETGKTVDIDRNTLRKKKPSTDVEYMDPRTGAYKTFKSKEDRDEYLVSRPISKSDALQDKFHSAHTRPEKFRTDEEKKFLGEYAPKLYPQYVEKKPEKPVDPMKGMNELQKANYRMATFGKDEKYKNSIQAHADSSTVYDKTKLPQFMPSIEKESAVNKLNAEIEALEGEISSYMISSKKKGDYVSPSKEKEHAKAAAQLKFKQSELLKLKGLKKIDRNPFDLDLGE